jgi:DNA-binding protein H-NS
MDDPENNRSQRIEELEEHYETIKDMIWSSSDDVQEEIVESDDAFMRAGKRALARVAPPQMPGEQSVSRLVGAS